MKKIKSISIRNPAQMTSLHQHGGLKIKEVVKLCPNYSQASINRHCKRHIGPSDPVDKTSLIGGDHPESQNKTDVQ